MRRVPGGRPTPCGRRRAALLPVVALLAACLSASCDTGRSGGPPPDRSTFVDVYVELRAAALRRDDRVLPDGERRRILAAHGVTEEDLVRFAEAHGADAPFMREVWDEIESRLAATRAVEEERGGEAR